MPQTLLPLVPDGATPINELVSVVQQNGEWTYFLGVYPIYTHPVTDRASFRLFTAQLVRNGLCKQTDIVKTFGISSISLKRSVKQHRQKGNESFYQPRCARGPTVMTKEVIRQAQDLLSQGNSRKETARQLQIKSDTLGKAIQQGKLSEPARVAAQNDAAPRQPAHDGEASDESQRGVQDVAAADGLGMACTRLVERVAAAVGLLPGGVPARYEACRDVTFGGVLCALPAERVGERQIGAGTGHGSGVELLQEMLDGAVRAGVR